MNIEIAVPAVSARVFSPQLDIRYTTNKVYLIRRDDMINSVSEGLSIYVEEDLTYGSRGEVLEEVLTDVCIGLAKAGVVTENKADLEMVLGVVGAYLIAKSKGTLPEDSKPPSYIFNTNLFPMLDEAKVEEEIIGDVTEEG